MLIASRTLRTLARQVSPPDISPVDEDEPRFPDMSRPNPSSSNNTPAPPPEGPRPNPRSNIPMLRRERRQQQDEAATRVRVARAGSRDDLRPGQDQRVSNSPARGSQGGAVWWDLSSEKGGPSQVQHPADYAQGLGSSPTAPPSQIPRDPNTSRIPSASFGDRLRRIARPSAASRSDTDPAAGAFQSNRPAWRGASGRESTVEPVHDDLSAAPLNIPRKSSKRAPGPRSPEQQASGSQGGDGSGGAGDGGGGRTASSPGGMETIMATPPVSPPTVPETGPSSPSPIPRDTLHHVVPSGLVADAQATGDEPHSSVAAATPETPSAGMQSYPSPPPTDAGPAHSTITALPSQSQAPTALTAPPLSSHLAIRRKPNPPHGHGNSVSSVSVYSRDFNGADRSVRNTYATPPTQGLPPDAFSSPTHPAPSDGWVQPPSRFSVTTYATSAHTSSPRASLDEEEAPPLPTPPQDRLEEMNGSRKPTAASAAGTGISVMDRTRPPRRIADHGLEEMAPGGPIVISLNTSWSSSAGSPQTTTAAGTPKSAAAQERERAARKPIGSASKGPRTLTMASTASSLRPSSIIGSDIHKSLPPAPGELESASAGDRVAQLNAQLRALGNRRININRSIKQMTELMPTDNLLASAEVIAKREVEKRKVEWLRTDLAEVQREEYELGLKLHRAYKRMDRDAEFEPTGLWVRRVTG